MKKRLVVQLGTGIYYPAEAARFLGISPPTMNRWARGYTFWSGESRSESMPVIASDLPAIGSRRALSFLELMELRVVAQLREHGLSLQYIRAAARLGRRVLKRRHPFATQRIYTDGKKVFSSFTPDPRDPEMIELSKDRHAQVILGEVFSPFLQEMVDFNPSTGVVCRWWPLGKGTPVVLDPNLHFGAPVVEGTRTQTYVVAGLAKADTKSEAALAYGLSIVQVDGAIKFERQLRHAA